MTLDQKQYRLSEDDHQAIFENEIKPDLFAGVKSSEHPVAIVFGGQPGAGKSAVVGKAADELRSRGGVVQIEGDALRDYHPAYARLMLKDDSTAAFYTDRDSGRWVEKAIGHAKEQRVNLVIEGTMRNPDVVAATMNSLREAGYEIAARALAVNWRLSEQGIIQRYENQKADRGVGRMTTPEAHKAAYDGMLHTLERIEREQLADRVTIYRRGNEAIYSNTLERGQWIHEPQAKTVLETERNRSMTLKERKDYANGFEKLANMVSRPERQASVEEVSNIDTLRHQANALYAIGRNREVLALMDRSYPKQDEARHAQIKAARSMLDNLDTAVMEKSNEVGLSNHQAALEMVKPSIHAVERSGIPVHHVLRQQWQLNMEHQIEYGNDKSR